MTPDLFFMFRQLLAIVCGVYAVVMTLNALLRWMNFFLQPQRYAGVLGTYVGLMLIRLSLRRFAGELAKIAGLAAATAVVIWAHRFI